MNRMNTVWDRILDRFITSYPEYEESIIYWCPSGHYEITVTLDNGDKIIYDDMDGRVIHICQDRDTAAYSDESRWRIEFANRLRRRMWICCLNQEMLSIESGISFVTISKYLNGKATPSAFHLGKLCRALKCSTTDLTEF